MITILSPAKTMNMDKSTPIDIYSQPVFIKNAASLIDELTKYSPPEMESLMKINNDLAEANFRRHVMWKETHNLSASKQALLAYHGMVYQGLSADTISIEGLRFAQEHLRILSGLYGVLKPLDLIQPYRLEMGTKLPNVSGKDLYAYWKDNLTRYFVQELLKHKDNALINLASNEYSTAIDMRELKGKIITPVFKDYKGGSYKVITIYAKKARGLMSRFIIENRIDTSEDLKEFNEDGYCFNEYMSTETQWVFIKNNR